MAFSNFLSMLPLQLVCLILLAMQIPMNFFTYIKELILWMVPSSYLHKDVKGKVILITGGAGSIGRSIALALAKKGAKIVSWDMNQEGNEETARIIKQNGGECLTYTVDISNREMIYTIAALVRTDVGFVDILINNAGIIGSTEFVPDMKDYTFEKTMDVNFFSHTWIVNAFLPDMIKANSGHIVSISSLCGISAHHFMEYTTTKFAVCGYIESLRLQLGILGHTGIVVSAICPSFIDTPLISDVFGAVDKMKLEYATKQFIDAILKEKLFLIFPKLPKILPLLKAMSPTSVMIQQYLLLNKTLQQKKV